MIQELSAPLVFFLHFKTNLLQWEAQKCLNILYSRVVMAKKAHTQLQLSGFMNINVEKLVFNTTVSFPPDLISVWTTTVNC